MGMTSWTFATRNAIIYENFIVDTKNIQIEKNMTGNQKRKARVMNPFMKLLDGLDCDFYSIKVTTEELIKK
jgi:hypothetical protein